MVQEISVDYFIRLSACQGKFYGLIREVAIHCVFSTGNELFFIFSVSSTHIFIYIMGKFAIMSLSVIA